MKCYEYFPTKIWVGKCDLDNHKLKEKIKEFSLQQTGIEKSNVGGYQGHDFYDSEWFDAIANSIPSLEENPIKKIKIFNWVNINSDNHYNVRHSHFNSNNFLSGVYYVSVPENSGRIRFWDPRNSWITEMPDNRYFDGGHAYYAIKPEDGMVIFFPSWLEHDVEPNLSGEERISIAFNIEADGHPNPINT